LLSNNLKILDEFKVKRIGIFGSYVLGEQNKRSDKDIPVEFRELVDLSNFLTLKNISVPYHVKKVDLVMNNSLKPIIGKCILKEVQYVELLNLT
jgi:uncharacterized protein